MSLELFLGVSIHDALAAIATRTQQGADVNIDEIATTVQRSVYQAIVDHATAGPSDEEFYFAKEQGALVEGLIRGFYRYVWPRLMQEYPRIAAVEQEMLYQHAGAGNHSTTLGFMSKPDLVLEDPTGMLTYLEYKSTSSKKDEWVNQWNTAVQLHSTIKAIETFFPGRKVGSVVVQGLYKGFVSYGKQSSPMCYSYQRKGSPPFSVDETRYDYAPGFKRYPTWELPGGVAKWVAEMPDEVLAEQFPCTPPIMVDDTLVDAFFRQRSYRETDIKLAMDVIGDSSVDEETKRDQLDGIFPQKFETCNPGWGKPCSYRFLCFGNVDNPLTQGYRLRDSHHQPELDQQNAANEVS